MALFLSQARFSGESWKALVGKPHDRRRIVARVMKAHGCKLLHFYWAFGDCDVVAIFEAPDEKAAMAALMTIASGGALAELRTTVLVDTADALDAMKAAKNTPNVYVPPGDA